MQHSLKDIFLLCALCLALAISGCSSSKGAGQPTAENPAKAPPESSAESPSGSAGAAALTLTGYGNTSSNLLHDGIAAEYDDYIYHVDKMMAGNIWRMPVGGGAGELLAKGDFHDLNVNGGVIFALGSIVDPETGSYVDGIVRMNIDGSNLHIVKEGYFEELILFDDYLYFADTIEGGLYRMKYDGSEEKMLLDGIYDGYIVIEGSLYICAELGEEYKLNVYKMPLDGSAEPQLIIEDIFGGSIYTAGDSIFYFPRDNTSDTCRYDAKTGEISVFRSNWIDYVNTDGERLYYFWSGVRADNADMGLYRCSLDGSGEEMILPSEPFFDLNIAGGKMFWHNNDEERRLTVVNLDGSEMGFAEQAQE